MVFFLQESSEKQCSAITIGQQSSCDDSMGDITAQNVHILLEQLPRDNVSDLRNGSNIMENDQTLDGIVPENINNTLEQQLSCDDSLGNNTCSYSVESNSITPIADIDQTDPCFDINSMEIIYVDNNDFLPQYAELKTDCDYSQAGSQSQINIISIEIVNTGEPSLSLEQKSLDSLKKNITESPGSLDSDETFYENISLSPKINDPVYEPSSNDSYSEAPIDTSDNMSVLGEINENIMAENEAEELGRPKRGRKRKFTGQTFKTKKKLQYANKDYYTEKGKYVASKTFLSNYKCSCGKCGNLVSEEKRRHLFDSFYKLANYDAQTGFLAARVQEHPIKRKRNKNSTKRSFTRTYSIDRITVCKDFFINTLRVSSKRINTALNKYRNGDVKDERGVQQGGQNKLSDVVTASIINHIKKFPTYKSHYCRSQTESRYLNYDITERKMYELFRDEHMETKVSFTCHKKIFYDNFNLRRKPRIKDTCSKCDTFNAKQQNVLRENDKEQLVLEHNQHLEEADQARKELKRDFETSKQNESIQTLTYDMEKTLPLPNIPTNLVFYKRQLWLYNEGIHCGNKAYCFIWKEGEAGRGGQEVGSCLKRFIELFLKQNTETLIMWSDSCGGQNRNIKVVLMLKFILSRHPTLKTIYFKYLVPGHSYLPNDSDFSDIEKALKLNQRIYTMQDYINIMKSCRRKNPLIITEMSGSQFFSVGDLEKEIVNRKIDVSKNKISWLKTKVIKLVKEKPFSIFLKYSHDENDEFHEVLLQKNVKRQAPASFKSDLQILWPNGKEISNLKLQDIKSLMPFIPMDAKAFYKNLKGMNFDDDLDGFGNQLDFEPDDEET